MAIQNITPAEGASQHDVRKSNRGLQDTLQRHVEPQFRAQAGRLAGSVQGGGHVHGCKGGGGGCGVEETPRWTSKSLRR